MPTHTLNLDVHIFDTDCYGVMWHGAYIKWLEMGRVELLKQCGQQLSMPNDSSPDSDTLIYPVVEQNLKFKSPARLNDPLVLTTSVEIQGHKLVFSQNFTQKTSDKLVLEAVTTCVVLNENWKPYRKVPEPLLSSLKA